MLDKRLSGIERLRIKSLVDFFLIGEVSSISILRGLKFCLRKIWKMTNFHVNTVLVSQIFLVIIKQRWVSGFSILKISWIPAHFLNKRSYNQQENFYAFTLLPKDSTYPKNYFAWWQVAVVLTLVVSNTLLCLIWIYLLNGLINFALCLLTSFN